MNDRRLARLAAQIKQRLATVLQRDIADPKLGLVTISRVELDKEFTQCKAYWSVIAANGKEEAARRASAEVLERATGFCQREVGAVLNTRSVPQLRFVFDEGVGGSARMQELLRELKPNDADDKDQNPSAPPAPDWPYSDPTP